MLSKIIQSKSKTFLAFCFCFLVSVAIGTLVPKKIETNIFLYLFFIIIFLLPFIIKKQTTEIKKPNSQIFFLLCLCFFVFGLFRVNISKPVGEETSIVFYNGQKQKLQGYVSKEPDIRTDGIRYIVEVQKKGEDAVHGKMYLKSDLYPRYQYGDILLLDCTLKTPEPIETFRYDMYLAKFGVFTVCQSSHIEKIGEGAGSKFYTKLLFVKSLFANTIQKLWHEPYASFVAGVLYGYQGGLGTLQEDFNRTGITHIVAISGYNISLISTIFSTFLVFLWIPRKRAFFITVLGILLFVIFTGASASVLRAGVMGILALLSKQLGRPSKIFNVIVLAITLLVLQNPYVLLWDAGFQLSVLSTVGLIYLSPKITPKLKFVPEFFSLRENLSSTLSAILITFPLILFEFGRFSTVAPIVNLLVLPGVPWVMAFGAVAVILTFFHLSFATIFTYITFFILKYMVTVVHWFSAFSFAAIDISLPVWGMVLCYAILFVVLWKKDSSSSCLPSSSS